MEHTSGTYRDGVVQLDEPVDWPEETPVQVVQTVPVEEAQDGEDFLGDGTRYPDTPEGVAELLRRMESVEPFELSEREANEIERRHRAWRVEQKELTRNEDEKLDHLFK